MFNINSTNFTFIFFGFIVYFALSYFEIIPAYNFYDRASTMIPILFVSISYVIGAMFNLYQKYIIRFIYIYKVHILIIALILIIILLCIKNHYCKKGKKIFSHSNFTVNQQTSYHHFISNINERSLYYYNKTNDNDTMHDMLFIFKDTDLISAGFYENADFKKEIEFKNIVLSLDDVIDLTSYSKIFDKVKTKNDLYKIISDFYKYYDVEDKKKRNKKNKNKNKKEEEIELKELGAYRVSEYISASGYSIVAVNPEIIDAYANDYYKKKSNK